MMDCLNKRKEDNNTSVYIKKNLVLRDLSRATQPVHFLSSSGADSGHSWGAEDVANYTVGCSGQRLTELPLLPPPKSAVSFFSINRQLVKSQG